MKKINHGKLNLIAKQQLILNEAINQGLTIGIIVCKKKNGYLFKYVTNKKIYERKYELV